MDNIQSIISGIVDQLPKGMADQLKEYLSQYTNDSSGNGILWLIAGLIVLYFVLKMLLPMVQSVVLFAILAAGGWFMYQKWYGDNNTNTNN